jgi:hypothetical protein
MIPALNDDNKGIVLTCMQDTTEDVSSVIAFEHYDDSWLEQLQE